MWIGMSIVERPQYGASLLPSKPSIDPSIDLYMSMHRSLWVARSLSARRALACLHACLHTCFDACLHTCLVNPCRYGARSHVCAYVCLDIPWPCEACRYGARSHVCAHVCAHVFTHAYTHVCTHVCHLSPEAFDLRGVRSPAILAGDPALVMIKKGAGAGATPTLQALDLRADVRPDALYRCAQTCAEERGGS